MDGMLQAWLAAPGSCALVAAGKIRRAQTLRIGLASVGDAAGRQRIKRQRGSARRHEVAVDVEHQIGGVGDITR